MQVNHIFSNSRGHYGRYYFEALDLVINSIKQRFNDQSGYRMYQYLESLCLKTLNKGNFNENLKEIAIFMVLI